MIKHVVLPAQAGQKYYDLHYRFFIETAKAAELDLELRAKREVGNTFDAEVNGRQVIVDFSDHKAIRTKRGGVPYFKFHYSSETHADKPEICSLTPVSFLDWDLFAKAKLEIRYKADGDVILNNQVPGGAASERRTAVQAFLKREFGALIDTEITDQITFWRKVKTCLVAVCVPGARIDILDRGQFQLMAFGACTISPQLDATLPFMRPLKAGFHYIKCADDFSDLGEIIEWTRVHRTSCREIGANAAKLFEETSLPWKIWGWISDCLEKEA